MRDQEDERITGDREQIERQESAPMSPAIHDHSARIGVDRAEQNPNRVESADQKNGRAEGLEIFRHETHPEFFSRADEEDRREEDDEIAFESEEIREATAAAIRV